MTAIPTMTNLGFVGAKAGEVLDIENSPHGFKGLGQVMGVGILENGQSAPDKGGFPSPLLIQITQ